MDRPFLLAGAKEGRTPDRRVGGLVSVRRLFRTVVPATQLPTRIGIFAFVPAGANGSGGALV